MFKRLLSYLTSNKIKSSFINCLSRNYLVRREFTLTNIHTTCHFRNILIKYSLCLCKTLRKVGTLTRSPPPILMVVKLWPFNILRKSLKLFSLIAIEQPSKNYLSSLKINKTYFTQG